MKSRIVLFTEKNIEHRILKYKLSNPNIESDPNSNKYPIEQEQLGLNVPVEVGKFDIPFLYDVSNNCLIDCYLQYKDIFSKFKEKMTDILDEIQVNVWDEMLHKKIQNQLEMIIKPLVHNMEGCFNAYVTNLSVKSSLSTEIKEARITITIIPNIDQKGPEFLISNIGIPFRNINLKHFTKNCVILLISY